MDIKSDWDRGLEYMRKPTFNETAVIGYGFYMFFTLLIEPNWMYANIEKNPDSMYVAYLNLLGSQLNIAVFSLIVALVTMGILFTQNYTFRIAVNLLGLVYFTIISASYIFSYPNLGLGLAAIIVVTQISNINMLIDEQQEGRKRKIIYDSYHDDEGGEEDDTEK